MNDNACPHMRDQLRIKNLVQEMADQVAAMHLKTTTANPAVRRAIAFGILAERKRISDFLRKYRTGKWRDPEVAESTVDEIMEAVLELDGQEIIGVLKGTAR